MRTRFLRAALLVALFTFVIVAGVPQRASAQEAAPAAAPQSHGAAKYPWAPEDMINSETASGFAISPDGKWIVWSKSVTNKEKDGRVSNLFLSSLADKKEIQLTRGTDTNANPHWSPDGDLIAFTSTKSNPDAKPNMSRSQIWLMNPFGGEPWTLTTFERGVQRFEWVDKDTIIFSAEEDPTYYERQSQERKDDSRVVDDSEHTSFVRLFKLSVKDKKVTRLTRNTDWIEGWSVTKDLSHAVTVHSRELSYAWDQKTPPQTYVWDLKTGQSKQVVAGPRIVPGGVQFARDGSGFYFAAPFTNDQRFFTASIRLLYFYDLASGQVKQVDLGWENGLAGGIDVTPDGFIASLAAGVRNKFARYTISGSGASAIWKRDWLAGDHIENIGGAVVSEDGKHIAYNYSTASLPGQWYAGDLDGARISNAKKITDLNSGWAKKEISKSEVIHWKGANNDDVEGILFYPHKYEAGKKYPLMLEIHGGPAGADHDSWSQSWAYPVNLVTERGAFVLKVNYHGSSDYGLKWVESICCGNYYDLEVVDLEKGVDNLIAKGLVDPDRIGTQGWSNGSILSIELTVKDPDRYKVASCGAGEVEWISDWANVDFGQSFDTYYFGKSPLEDPQLYLKKSPLFELNKVKTPTIIFFGTNDRNVPTEEGWTHYRALYTYGKVPVRFVLFPGEPHSPQKLSHQLRKVDEEMVWLDRYFFKNEDASNEAFKSDSPLGEALRRNKIARTGAAYGSMAGSGGKQVLAPEVVTRGKLEIGRFEVTRAQFAAFDSSYKFAPGTENYPANDISFDRAKAYADWLSRATGQMWRVPNESEVASLYNGHTNENTLDYWAGYTINPEDGSLLLKKVSELSGDAPLLKEVGSFKGQGSADEELIFDLGGNVAEWVIASDGSGKTLGGSADRPLDTKSAYEPASAAYTGFRVVRGAPAK